MSSLIVDRYLNDRCHVYNVLIICNNSFPLMSFWDLKVVDCRVCGDPNSVLRFAFIEFTNEGTFHLNLSLLVKILFTVLFLKRYCCRGS